ncbi:MAG: hypothetical protein AB7K04_10925 [Pseudorhodoplanes sp.]
MIRTIAALGCAATLLIGGAAFAAYPIGGRWTYDNVSGEGPAPSCGKRVMEFGGDRRSDNEGGVHDYRNVTTFPIGTDTWRLTDEFFNGQIQGRVVYTLKRTGNDHIEIRMQMGGKTFRLRRCG